MSPSSQGLSGDARQLASTTPALACITTSIRLAATAHSVLAARADYRRFELNAARLISATWQRCHYPSTPAAQLEATTAILRVQDEQLRQPMNACVSVRLT